VQAVLQLQAGKVQQQTQPEIPPETHRAQQDTNLVLYTKTAGH
jgi:hypothetical protein